MIFECPHCAEHITVPANLVGGQLYCPACGQAMAIPSNARTYSPGTPLQSLQYAGFWIRFLAALLDSVIILIPMLLSNMIIPIFGGVVVFVLYKGLCLANWDGQTVGKKACGIKVLNEDFQPITQGQAFGRTLAEFLSTFILYIGYIMAGFTERKQALHDKVAGTVHIYA